MERKTWRRLRFLRRLSLEHRVDDLCKDAEFQGAVPCGDFTSKDVGHNGGVRYGGDVCGDATHGAGLGRGLVKEASRFDCGKGGTRGVRVFQDKVFASCDASVGCTSGLEDGDALNEVGFVCARSRQDNHGGGKEGKDLGGCEGRFVDVARGVVDNLLEKVADFTAGS